MKRIIFVCFVFMLIMTSSPVRGQSLETPFPQWENKAQKVFFIHLPKYRFGQVLIPNAKIVRLKQRLSEYPPDQYWYYWGAASDEEVRVYDNLRTGRQASKLDQFNSNWTFAWQRVYKAFDMVGGDKAQVRYIKKKERRGIYLYLIPKGQIPGILAPPEETGAYQQRSNSEGLYPFVEAAHNEWYQGSTMAINDQRIGFGYQSKFNTEWFLFDAQFSPLNYRRVSDYFSLADVHQYSSASIRVFGKLKFMFFEFSGMDYFVHDYEHGSWDENTIVGKIGINPWRLRLSLTGQTSYVNYLEEVRQSTGNFYSARARLGVEPFKSRKSRFELGWQGTNSKFVDDFWERSNEFRYGGVYLTYDYSANFNGLIVKFWTDLAWEKTNEVILEKATDLVVDPPVDRYQVIVGASLFF